MDHKISKDMISSGMIPSGEKTQADLGRTQYGSAPSPSSLMDAYKTIYEHHEKDADGKVIEHEVEETTPSSVEESKKDPDVLSQDVDLFDLIKGRLLDEGADEEEALKIMVNLSEEERENILQNINELKNWINKKLNQARNNSQLGGNKRVDDVRAGSGDPNVGTKINFQ